MTKRSIKAWAVVSGGDKHILQRDYLYQYLFEIQEGVPKQAVFIVSPSVRAATVYARKWNSRYLKVIPVLISFPKPPKRKKINKK